MQADLLVSATQYDKKVKGEWRSLAASNVLLSERFISCGRRKHFTNYTLGNRFGARQRPYVVHEAKSASVAILHEISAIWLTQVEVSATHPFRETLHGESDFSMMFLMVHFVVERWREALLWSWTVAKHGGLDDSWGEREELAAWEDLGGKPGVTSGLFIHAAHRQSLEPERVEANLHASGSRDEDPTKYAFSEQKLPYHYISY